MSPVQASELNYLRDNLKIAEEELAERSRALDQTLLRVQELEQEQDQTLLRVREIEQELNSVDEERRGLNKVPTPFYL